jgi:TRAP-type C4-dicarboxylate transport system permease small subunit
LELVGQEYFNIVALIAMVAGLAIAGWLVVALYSMSSREKEDASPTLDMPDGLQEGNAGTPPALILFYAMVVVVMVTYVLYNWLGGVSY